MIRLAIVEDEDKHAQLLQDYSARYSGETHREIAAERFKNGLQFLEAFRANFDAVLMDIAMPVMDGMECAKKLRELDERIPILFTTSMAQYAIRGYEVEALGFMVKPVKYPEFARKLDRIVRRIDSRQAASYVLPLKDGAKVVNISDIYYVEVLAHYLIFHTRSGEYKIYGVLSSLEEDSRFSRFLKVTQSHLVNSDHVANIGKDSLTVAGEQLPLSRRRRSDCLEKIARIMGGGLS